MKMTDQYVAGFFDGEGCVRIERNIRSKVTHYPPRVIIGQRTREVLVAIQKHLGLGYITFNRTNGNWFYRIGGVEEVREFCRRIKPYSIVKKSLLQLMEQFLATKGDGPKPAHRLFYEKFKQINSGHWRRKS